MPYYPDPLHVFSCLENVSPVVPTKYFSFWHCTPKPNVSVCVCVCVCVCVRARARGRNEGGRSDSIMCNGEELTKLINLQLADH